MQTSYIYILTNIRKTIFYIGITNNLERRVHEHKNSNDQSFTRKYNIHFLVYFEEFTDINKAIEREKQLKGWTRMKKEKLIRTINPEFKWLDLN